MIILPTTVQLSNAILKLDILIIMEATVRLKMPNSAQVVRLDRLDKTRRANMLLVARSQLMVSRKRRIVATTPLTLRCLVNKRNLRSKCIKVKDLKGAIHMAIQMHTASNTRNMEDLT
jgi:hypothetical protein